MTELETWASRSSFSYEGSIQTGTIIYFGTDGQYSMLITKQHYHDLLDHFIGSTVKAGTSRTDPQTGSLGEWLMAHVTRTAIASYVGAILMYEGYAEKVNGSSIRFKR
jgi:hypothetical protein